MNKIRKLKNFFKIYNIDGYLVPKNDEFFGEYIPDYKDNLKFISNYKIEKNLILLDSKESKLINNEIEYRGKIYLK